MRNNVLRLIIIILILGGIELLVKAGINSPKEELKVYEAVSQEDTIFSKLEVTGIFTVVIDKCEYLVGVDENAGISHNLKFVTHKGNCRNCTSRK